MPKASKRSGRREKPAHGAKAEFVRAHPGVPAGELVELGKKRGLEFSVGHIYNIRAAEKRRGSKNGNGATATATAGTKRATNGAAATATGGSDEAQLRSLVLRMGFDRVDAVLGRLRSQLKDLE